MFYEKWSHKVTLPLGTKWGNNIGGVAGCLNWSRPQPSSFEDWMRGGGGDSYRAPEVTTNRATPIYTDRTLGGTTGRNYRTNKVDSYPLNYRAGVHTPTLDYYPGKPDIYDPNIYGGGERLASAAGMRTNEEDLLQKLKSLTKQHEKERKARALDRNTKTKTKKLAFDTTGTGTQKGYGFMGPPPKRYTPTPPPNRSRPSNPIPRPQSSAGKTETYRYTEREITIEDFDEPAGRSYRKERTVTPIGPPGYNTSKYGSVQGLNRSKRPSSAFSMTTPDLYYPPQHEVDNFDPTPLAWQNNDFTRPLSKAEFLRKRSQTPQRALTYNNNTTSRPYTPNQSLTNKRHLSTTSKDDENITINVDCAKLTSGVSRPKTVTVRLHGVDSGEAGNIKVLTVPNTAGSM